MSKIDEIRARWATDIAAAVDHVKRSGATSPEAQRLYDIATLLVEVERLRGAIDRIMIGGNHLATYLGNQLSPAEYDLPYQASFDEAFKVFGDGNIRYEAWVCWREMMQVRDALGLYE